MKRLISSLALLSAVALAVVPRAAHAQLVVDRMIVDFSPGEPARQDILLQNKSKDRYYITVTPAEVVKPRRAGQ